MWFVIILAVDHFIVKPIIRDMLEDIKPIEIVEEGVVSIPIGKYNGFDTAREYELMKRLHRFHGTNSSFYEYDRWWFYRNGRRCELWDPLSRE
jgi:hypothetical protein